MSDEKDDGIVLHENAPVDQDDRLPEKGSPERLLAERRIVRKLDVRVLPMIFLIFVMNYIDVSVLPLLWCRLYSCSSKRNAVTTARLKGLEEDLGLTGMPFISDQRIAEDTLQDIQYSTLLSTLYATYCTAQIPSNMVLNYIKRCARSYSPFIVFNELV